MEMSYNKVALNWRCSWQNAYVKGSKFFINLSPISESWQSQIAKIATDIRSGQKRKIILLGISCALRAPMIEPIMTNIDRIEATKPFGMSLGGFYG